MISGLDAYGNREVAATKDRRSISQVTQYREHKVAPARTIKPDQSEFLPYFARYTDLVPDGDIVVTLTQQMKETLGLLRALPDSAAMLRYAPDKWTLNQMIGHVI